VRLVDQPLDQLARRALPRQIVFVQFQPFTFQVGDRLAAARSARFEPYLERLDHHVFLTHQASGAAAAAGFDGAFDLSAAIISSMSGVQLPPQYPVVAVVRVAIWLTHPAPSRMARSIVRYLTLLHRQTVVNARIAGCRSQPSVISARLTHEHLCGFLRLLGAEE
jgi:hypothetical protein